MAQKTNTPPNAVEAPFGTCPWCQHPLAWSSDEPWVEDESVTIRYLSCPHCGADIEAMECIPEERHNYPDFWIG